MEDGFWKARASLLSPIPEVEAAADLLALAAESLLLRDEMQARSYLGQANMPALRSYTRSIQSQVTDEVHRLRDVPGLTAAVVMLERSRRMPSPATALGIYRRDGFRCRYCGCRVVSPKAQGVISKLLPGAVRWGPSDAELNAAFYTLKGVLDHVEPHAHGGTSDPENLVVSCQPCNYGKGNWFIQQLGLSDPRLRVPRVDDWDGLLRVLSLRPARVSIVAEGNRTTTPAEKPGSTLKQRSVARPRPVSVDNFAADFSVADRRHLDALLEMVESRCGFGVSWKLKRVLLVKIRVGDIILDALGIEPDVTVQIPWSIGPHKQAFRSFAETLAAAMPDAEVYETEKWWRVRCRGRYPRISELMHDPDAVQHAFDALHRALRHPAVDL